MNELEPTRIQPPVTNYARYSAQHMNVTNSGEQLKTMLDAAWGATRAMKQAGQTNFDVSITAGSDYSLERVSANAYRRFLAIATHCSQHNIPVADLSEEQKFAICVASRVPLEPIPPGERSKLMFTLRTAKACGIVLEPGTPGRYVVYVKP